MNDTHFEAFIHCVTNKEFVEERKQEYYEKELSSCINQVIEELKQQYYLEAFEGCLIALAELPCLTDEEAKRKTAITITRAYNNGLITAEESQKLMNARRKILQKYRKGVND